MKNLLENVFLASMLTFALISMIYAFTAISMLCGSQLILAAIQK